MIRSARRRHALIWLVVGPLILVGFVLAVAWRPAPAISSGPVPVAPADRSTTTETGVNP